MKVKGVPTRGASTPVVPPVDPKHTALLVMDYQTAILGSLSNDLGNADALLARTTQAIAAFRWRGAHVGYVRVAFEDADFAAIPSTNKMFAGLAAAGRDFHSDSPGTAIDERIAPKAGDIVVRKTRVGAFSTTDLDQQLRDRGIDTLVLAGISTSGVVLSTVRAASDLDYRVIVLADGCADREPDVHDFLIEKIFPRQADVITYAELHGLFAGPEESPSS